MSHIKTYDSYISAITIIWDLGIARCACTSPSTEVTAGESAAWVRSGKTAISPFRADADGGFANGERAQGLSVPVARAVRSCRGIRLERRGARRWRRAGQGG